MDQSGTSVDDYITAANFIAVRCHQVSHGQPYFDHLSSSDRQIPGEVLIDLRLLEAQESYPMPYLWKVTDPTRFAEHIKVNIATGPSYDVVLCAMACCFFEPDGDEFDFLVEQGVFERSKQINKTVIGTEVQVPVLTARGRELEALTLTWPWKR